MDTGACWCGCEQQLAINNITSPGRGHANRLKDKHIVIVGGRWVRGAVEAIAPMACLRFHPFQANG